MYNCIQKQIEFPLLILLTQEVYYYENKFMFAETLKYCRFFAEKDNSPGKTMVEGKARGGSSVLRYYQSIAALLTVSKIQRLRHRDESDALPMVIVNPTDVVILVYQPETDTLIITQVLPWEKVTVEKQTNNGILQLKYSSKRK